jgi:hypothetical protein
LNRGPGHRPEGTLAIWRFDQPDETVHDLLGFEGIRGANARLKDAANACRILGRISIIIYAGRIRRGRNFVEDRGAMDPWLYQNGVNVERRKLVAVRIGDCFKRELTSAIGSQKRHHNSTRGRADVDQQAATLAPHARQHSPIHADCSQNIGIENLLDLVDGVSLGDADIRESGIVDDDVKVSGPVERLTDRWSTELSSFTSISRVSSARRSRNVSESKASRLRALRPKVSRMVAKTI